MTNLFKKPNPANVKEIETQIENLKKEIKEHQELLEVKDSKMWAVIQKIINRKLNMLEFKMDNFEKFNSEERIVFLADRRTMKLFLSLVDNTDLALAHLEGELSQAESNLSDLKSRLGD